MKYVVVEDFTDLQDDNHVYRVGDVFPRKGKGNKARVKELTTVENKRGLVLIQEVEEPLKNQEG